MIEVFKTDVVHPALAGYIIELIEERFQNCRVNFDLADCDHVLRIASNKPVDPEEIVLMLKKEGVSIEVLPDTVAIARSNFDMQESQEESAFFWKEGYEWN